MKTIREWLEELPEPYRTQALENVGDKHKNTEVATPHEAIGYSFVWFKTPEGNEYWCSLYRKLLNSPHGT